MAKIDVPFLVIKPGRRLPNGTRTKRYFWQPSKKLRAAGWIPERLPDIEEKAIARAKELNARLKAWRQGQDDGPGEIMSIGPEVKPNSVAHVIRLYKDSPWFKKLRPKTQREYGYCLNALEVWAGDKPVRHVTRKAVLAYYAGLYETKPVQANMNIKILRRLLGFAFDIGMVAENVAKEPRLINTEARVRIWTPAEIAAAVAAADALGYASVGDAILLALYSGQRQGDLLALKVVQYNQGRITLRQSKRRARISVQAHPTLAARLAEAERRRQALDPDCPTVLICETTKRPWGADHFRHIFAEIRAVAVNPRRYDNQLKVRHLDPCKSIFDAWFMDLRDTAVTKLGEAGATLPEICSITGHSERSAMSILRHYLDLTGDMADAAIAKLVAHEEKQAQQQDAEAE